MTKKKKPNEHLIYLQFGSNTCICQVVDKRPKGLRINNDGTWSCEGKAYPIGQDRPSGRGQYLSNSGPIGVYDRRKLSHLKAMVSAAVEAQRQEGNILDD